MASLRVGRFGPFMVNVIADVTKANTTSLSSDFYVLCSTSYRARLV